MFKPSVHDNLKNRRTLAMIAACHCFFVWPYVVLWMSHCVHISDELANHMLNYMIVMSSGPMAAYFIAAQKNTGMSIKDFVATAGNSARNMLDSGNDCGSPTELPGQAGSGFVAPTEGETE